MPNSVQANQSWEILVVNQEENAWFRDNLARVLCLLGQGELQSHLFAAMVAQDGYEALRVQAGAAVRIQVELECERGARQVTVRTECELEDFVLMPRICRWPCAAEAPEAFARTCQQVEHQWARKCKRQMTREMLEQNQELLRRLEAVNVAERAAEAKGAFLASMSHELRTPMNSILGFTRRLRRRLDGKIDDKDLQALDVVTRNGKHLLSMINDILDFSKLEADQEGLTLERIAPSDIVQAVILQCDPLLHEGQTIRFVDCTPSGFQVTVDAGKLGQILTNLVSNAIKYGGGKDIEVHVERRNIGCDGSSLAVRVIDQGKGMSEQEQTTIFSPFTRLDNDATRGASGTGLGLAIAQRYAKMHGGCLEVDSAIGQGSTFCLVLPEEQEKRRGLQAYAA